jgi:uncharacterized protein DUF4389
MDDSNVPAAPEGRTRIPSAYPVDLQIDYPDRELSRLTTFFRVFTVIPIAIVLGLLSGGTGDRQGDGQAAAIHVGATGIVVLPTILMLLFRQKYPRWWFDWNVNLSAFSYRVMAYIALLRDEYPSTDEEQAVQLSIPYPDARRELNRWLPVVKWILAIPHYIVLGVLAICAVVVVILAWFAVLFTGRYPRPLFDFIVGVLRWSLRVGAYAFLLVTDRYPPFHF